jgi:hypothetical protein
MVGRWLTVDLGPLRGHEVCGNKGEWINGPSFSLHALPPLDDGSFHPDLKGAISTGWSGERSTGDVLIDSR